MPAAPITVTISDIASSIMAIATAGSMLYISRQLSVTRKQTKGQFLLALDEQFEKSNEITIRLINEEGFTPQGKDWPEIFRLMSVFERINIMVEDNILDIAIVDRLHGFRLMHLIANDTIYQRLQTTGAEWQDFIDLCYAVAEHQRTAHVTVDDEAFIERVSKLSKDSPGLKNAFTY